MGLGLLNAANQPAGRELLKRAAESGLVILNVGVESVDKSGLVQSEAWWKLGAGSAESYDLEKTRQIRIFFGGGKEMEQKHHLFTLPKPLTPKEIWDRLWVSGWGYNALSQTYKGQIYTMRKVVPPRHQYHLRFYKNGDVSGHFEVDNLQFPL